MARKKTSKYQHKNMSRVKTTKASTRRITINRRSEGDFKRRHNTKQKTSKIFQFSPHTHKAVKHGIGSKKSKRVSRIRDMKFRRIINRKR